MLDQDAPGNHIKKDSEMGSLMNQLNRANAVRLARWTETWHELGNISDIQPNGQIRIALVPELACLEA